MLTSNNERRRKTGRLFMTGAAMIGAGTMTVGTLSTGTAAAKAGPPVSASFILGVLTVIGDAQDNSIVVSRDAAGRILVNGGSVVVRFGNPTVANTRAISVVGLAGSDTLTLDEANGALPKANLVGGTGNDVAHRWLGRRHARGSGRQRHPARQGWHRRTVRRLGQRQLDGRRCRRPAFGEAGDDRSIWNPGDDTDLNEGGAGVDTTEVNGGNGAEQFTATRQRRACPVRPGRPRHRSASTSERSENLILNANGGDDSFSATGNLATLIAITVDGGAGNDTILGSNGDDVLLGGAGNDFVDGQQGNDIGLLGSEDDVFQWDPGDGSDVVEGQDGFDTMLFNGSNANENFDVSANGRAGPVLPQCRQHHDGHRRRRDDRSQRPRRRRQPGRPRHVRNVPDRDRRPTSPRRRASGVGDGQSDGVIVDGTTGDDVAVVAGQGSDLQVVGLATSITVSGAEPALDRLTVSVSDGSDVVDASGIAAGSMALVIDGGDGDDVLIGGDGDDSIAGGEGDDVLHRWPRDRHPRRWPR